MENIFPGAKLERKPSGAIMVDGVEVAHTMQCCHCGKHFISVKGSGIRRGFCLRCHKITCGDPGCDACIPAEMKLEIIENQETRRIIIAER